MSTMAARAAYRGGGKESITIAMSTMAARAAYRGGGKESITILPCQLWQLEQPIGEGGKNLLLYSHVNYGS